LSDLHGTHTSRSGPADGAEARSASGTGLRAATARGVVWTTGQALLNRVLSLLGFVVLARLLSPQEYGVVGLASVFSTLCAIVAQAGLSQALVQQPHVDKEDLDTVFWIGLGLGAGLAVALSAAAWPLADAFNEPELRPVLQVLSVTFLFIAFSSTSQAVLQRRLAFRQIATANITANLVATVVGITFAVLGLGVWSLVVQTGLWLAIVAIMLTAISGYRPALYVSLPRFRPLFAFSRNYLGSSVMTFVNTRTDDFLIGSVLGSVALGIYGVAYRVLTVMMDVFGTSVRQVAFPVFAQVQTDIPRLRRAYHSAMRMCAVVVLPCYLFVAVAAPELVHVIFGPKWAASAPVLRILCLYGALQAVTAFNGSLLQSVGRARLVFRIMLIESVLQVAAFAVAVPYGISWVAASYVIRAYLMAPVGLVIAARALDSTVTATLSGTVPPLVSSAAMVASMFAARAILPEAPVGVQLIALAAVALVIYPAVLWLVGRAAFNEATGYVRSAVSGRRAHVATGSA